MRQAVTLSQRLSITLGYLGAGNDFEDLKLLNAISCLSVGIIVLETCLFLGTQAVNERILHNTVYRMGARCGAVG
jgi:hypothetical protein